MSDDKKPPETGETGMVLAKNQQQFLKLFQHASHKRRSNTDSKAMTKRRRTIAGVCEVVEKLSEALTAGADTLSVEDAMKMSNSINITAMVAMTMELEYICDCLSLAHFHKIRGTDKMGEERVPIALIFDEILATLAAEDDNPNAEPGILDNQSTGLEMINDIGNKLQAFTNKDGVHDPNKYGTPEKTGASAPEVDETEVVTEEESERIKNEAKEKHKK